MFKLVLIRKNREISDVKLQLGTGIQSQLNRSVGLVKSFRISAMKAFRPAEYKASKSLR